MNRPRHVLCKAHHCGPLADRVADLTAVMAAILGGLAQRGFRDFGRQEPS
jgi:hypothetical protein